MQRYFRGAKGDYTSPQQNRGLEPRATPMVHQPPVATRAGGVKPAAWVALALVGCSTALVAAYFWRQGDSAAPEPSHVAAANLSTSDDNATAGMIAAPGVERREYISPLADAYRRIDPSEDGWETEAFHEASNSVLGKLAKELEKPQWPGIANFSAHLADDFACSPWLPMRTQVVFADQTTTVRRREGNQSQGAALEGAAGFAAAAEQLTARYATGRIDHVKLKQFEVHDEADGVRTRVLLQTVGTIQGGSLEINSTWSVSWSRDVSRPLLRAIQIDDYEEVQFHGSGDFMFADCTESVLGNTDAYREQFLYSTDHWRARLPRDLGLDVVANHGLAVGDVNGDELDDLYVCQQGGLPNRLLIQNKDGTARDVSAYSGADWLDYCASALLVDLDNDGDRDLVVAQEWRIVFMSNDGRGRFTYETDHPSGGQSFSMTTADFDRDGDLDVYTCGYNPSGTAVRRGAMGEPMPYHDANNGGRNLLLRNEGRWRFTDVTAELGLDENNTRHSFAAAWEDFDNDGDPDLYVANDYGRNNLYRNNDGRFDDIAFELDVEDVSAGMSVSWGDYNRDGWMDLYVANMFSAAGNRITYQRKFKAGIDDKVRQQFQRHARGNTLYRATGDGQFEDVSVAAGVTMGRWAWGSRFVDINSDGWEDLVVANGFITTADTGDL